MKIIEQMKKKHVLIGMIHCLPLPGTMNYNGSMDAIIEKAVADAKILEKVGFDAVLVEPTLDLPAGMKRGQLQIAAMSIVCSAVRRSVDILMGVSFLTPDCMDLCSVAKASGADFVRVTTFVDTVIFPAGISYPNATRVWEVRSQKGMEDIAVLADIQVKHGKLMYPETTIEESAYFAERQGADAVIVTGNTTGEETPLDTIRRVKDIVKIPVVVGSGVRKETIAAQMEAAEGFIIGSSIKEGGKLAKPVNEKMALALADAKKMAECSI